MRRHQAFGGVQHVDGMPAIGRGHRHADPGPPVKFDIRDVGWSDRDPANVMANVDVSSSNPRGPRFSFPMEFKPFQGGWQLSARTADVLLAFRTESAPPPAAPGH